MAGDAVTPGHLHEPPRQSDALPPQQTNGRKRPPPQGNADRQARNGHAVETSPRKTTALLNPSRTQAGRPRLAKWFET